jgi:molybdenum cofactor synthesis domain-containing protein
LFVNHEVTPKESRGLAGIGILVISDRASRGEYDDKSGIAINEFLNRTIQSNWIAIVKIIPDGVDSVAKALVEMSDREGCDLILTTDGTGPSPRDLTPEGTRTVITRELEGFGELMRRVSLEYVPTAILSRQTAGTRGPLPDRQSAGAAVVDRRLPQRRISGDSVLSRPDRCPSNRGEARCLSCLPPWRLKRCAGRRSLLPRSSMPTKPIPTLSSARLSLDAGYWLAGVPQHQVAEGADRRCDVILSSTQPWRLARVRSRIRARALR